MTFKDYTDATDYICAHQFEIKDKKMREPVQIVMVELMNTQGKAIELEKINERLSKCLGGEVNESI